MTTYRALAIITIATLPLAVLSARGFLASPSSDPATMAPPTYAGGTDELAAGRKAAAEPSAAVVDPVGWGRPRKPKPADEPVEYHVAAALAEGGRAAIAKGDAIADVTAAVTEIGGLLAEPRRAEIVALPGGQGLLDSLQARRAGLQRHSKWLEDRAAIKSRIAVLEAMLTGPPDGTREKKCVDEINDVGVQFPAVVDDDDSTEPPNARTKSDERALEAIRSRASFRREYHAAMMSDDPEDKLRQIETFLRKHASALDPRDAQLLDDAKQQSGVARLAVFRAKAEKAETAEEMATALKRWLAEPPAGPDNRKAEAMVVIKTWLARNVPEPPGIAKLPELLALEEAIMLFGNEEQRMLGVFERTPNQPGKWRFWQDRADRADPNFKRGRGDVTVPDGKAPMKPPVFVENEKTYRLGRERLLAAPLDAGVAEKFAQQTGELTNQTATHRAIPKNTNAAHYLQEDYETLGEGLEAACQTAEKAARAFAAAAKENGLRSLLP